MSELFKKAKEIADVLKKQKKVQIVTHIDADGISSGSIASQTLRREGIDFNIRFLKKLDEMEISRIEAPRFIAHPQCMVNLSFVESNRYGEVSVLVSLTALILYTTYYY